MSSYRRQPRLRAVREARRSSHVSQVPASKTHETCNMQHLTAVEQGHGQQRPQLSGQRLLGQQPKSLLSAAALRRPLPTVLANHISPCSRATAPLTVRSDLALPCARLHITSAAVLFNPANSLLAFRRSPRTRHTARPMEQFPFTVRCSTLTNHMSTRALSRASGQKKI